MRQHKTHAEIVPDDHISGNPAARVKLIEYGDFECPHCGAAHPIVKQLQQTLGEDLCFVFRHFPIRMGHPHAENAAEASEAAATIQKFWPMHNLLFENQENLDDEALLQMGQMIGLRPEQLRRDLEDHRYYSRVQRDVMSGMRSGVNGTPTFFINGERHNGSYQFSDLIGGIVAAGLLTLH
jgi:protein-disulfide isomerase